MRCSRFAALVAVMCFAAFISGCWHKLKIEATPEINNPVVDVASDSRLPFQAGFASEVITPEGRAWMAGYNFLRRSTGVHDDLFARALVLRQGDEKLAMVSLDLVGLNRFDVEKIKAGVAGFRPDQILVACTHVHAGPDTMGLWGLPPVYSGRDEEYMEKLSSAIVRVIGRANEAARPVGVWTAVYQMNPDLMYNMNEGEPEDETMGIMVFRDEAGSVVATLINATGHPEVMYENNNKISADYPGVVYRLVEQKYGGGAILFSGTLGSLITPAIPHKSQREDHDFEDVEYMGRMVAAEVDKGMAMLVREDEPSIKHRMSLIQVPATNRVHKLAVKFGLLERHVYEGLSFITEVNLIEIGSAQFVTFPGEAYPKQGLNIRAHQKPNSFQITLANDELGYILYPGDYGSEEYDYESTLCPGPDLAVEIEKALILMLEN